jgi:hypothetical protein
VAGKQEAGHQAHQAVKMVGVSVQGSHHLASLSLAVFVNTSLAAYIPHSVVCKAGGWPPLDPGNGEKLKPAPFENQTPKGCGTQAKSTARNGCATREGTIYRAPTRGEEAGEEKTAR